MAHSDGRRKMIVDRAFEHEDVDGRVGSDTNNMPEHHDSLGTGLGCTLGVERTRRGQGHSNCR